MIFIKRKRFLIKTIQVWFSEAVCDMNGYCNVRFSGCPKDLNLKQFRKKKYMTSVIDLTSDLDVLWQRIDKKSCKYSINRAKKDNIQIHINQDYSEFYKIYRSFIKKKILEFQKIWRQ